MPAYLGIDTGGTYTDAVLFDPSRGVLASAKALTRRHDLTLGIRESLGRVLAGHSPAEIELVSLSTTLATNSVVEGQGSPICLLLIGYPPDCLDQHGLRQAMGRDPVVFVEGGHDARGEEARPLDLAAVRQAVERFAPRAAAFAVSGYFAVRNPSHENAARALIRELSGRPVTCGHELTANLHASRRALTAALNARLIPVLSRLIEAMERLMEEAGLAAPLMVVKGDGSLISARFAEEHPIETILSGPAASVVGALFLSGEREACVVDMGGTTTDIALVRDGRPVLNAAGAEVGGWHTMVEAVRVYTCGLGGDSEVHPADLSLGPRRHVPLSLLAAGHPSVLPELERQCRRERPGPHDGRFLLLQRPLEPGIELSALQRSVLQRLQPGPLPWERLAAEAESAYLVELELRGLVERGLAAVSAFTPSDAAHVLGFQRSWSAEAARRGAELAARAVRAAGKSEGGPAGGHLGGLHPRGKPADAEELCRRVLRQVALQSGRAVVTAAFRAAADGQAVDLDRLPAVRRAFVDRALGERPDGSVPLSVGLTLDLPLVAIGAPVSTYYPEVAAGLHTRLVVPPHAGVANAVGAVVGGVAQTVRVLITPQEAGERFRVHFEEGIRDFDDLEEAAAFAEERAAQEARRLAGLAGVAAARVEVSRRDRTAQAAGQEMFLESLITATAAGRPRLGAGG